MKQLCDLVIAREFSAPDLEFAWSDDQPSDPEKVAAVAVDYVKAGIKSVNEVRAELGLDPVPGGDRPIGVAPAVRSQPQEMETAQGAVPLGSKPPAARASAKKVADRSITKYNPDQPRLPAGQSGGGQWTSASDSAGSRAVYAATNGTVVRVEPSRSNVPNAGVQLHIRGSDGATYIHPRMDANTVPDVGTSVVRGDYIGDIADGSDPGNPRHADGNGIQAEPLAPPQHNIPGTNIPDHSIPEDGHLEGLGPTPHEHTDPGILHTPPWTQDHNERHCLPQDIKPCENPFAPGGERI